MLRLKENKADEDSLREARDELTNRLRTLEDVTAAGKQVRSCQLSPSCHQHTALRPTSFGKHSLLLFKQNSATTLAAIDLAGPKGTSDI